MAYNFLRVSLFKCLNIYTKALKNVFGMHKKKINEKLTKIFDLIWSIIDFKQKQSYFIFIWIL